MYREETMKWYLALGFLAVVAGFVLSMCVVQMIQEKGNKAVLRAEIIQYQQRSLK